VDRGAIHAVAGNHHAWAFAFTHPLYRHESYRFLRFAIQFASISFYQKSDNTWPIKFPGMSAYLLTKE
jgi:hypothetical protein